MNKALLSSNSNEWYTPQYVMDYIKRLGYECTLDPCASEHSAKCDMFFTEEDDGLKQSWEGNTVFVNPPYGREIKDWVKKTYEESRKPNTECIMLIPARTDTKYWHDYIFPYASNIIFLKGRIKFLKPALIDGEIQLIEKDAAPFPSALVIFGQFNEGVTEVAGIDIRK